MQRSKKIAIYSAAALVVGILAAASWWVWQSRQASNSTSRPATKVAITSYEQCIKADGSKVLQTYPEQCVTSTGKTFTASSSPTKSTGLVIQEWGIQLPLTSDIADAMYTMGDGGTAHITTPALTSLAAKQTGCKAGMDDIYIMQSTAASQGAVHIGTYYYSQYHPIETTCLSRAAPSDMASIRALQASLIKAIQHITAANTP